VLAGWGFWLVKKGGGVFQCDKGVKGCKGNEEIAGRVNPRYARQRREGK